jgi:hypothetical protein
VYEFKIVFGNVTLDVVNPDKVVKVVVFPFTFADVVALVIPVPAPIPVLETT